MNKRPTDGAISLERRARTASAKFIQKAAHWRWFATLTFEYGISDQRADQAIKDFCRSIAQSADQHFQAAWVREDQHRDVAHFHALLSARDGIAMQAASLERAWRAVDSAAGFSRFARFDEKRRAAQYMLKDKVRGSDWSFEVVCPRLARCRRQGCTLAVIAW